VWVLEATKAVDVGNQSSPLLFSWVTCVWVLEAAIAVDVPSVSVVVVAKAIKTKTDHANSRTKIVIRDWFNLIITSL